uniref:Uncharacterized protein n=1 Tax=Anguilla anguilla TaxID=7936 RepID=A0A0E9SVX6_ANGAN
MLHSYSWSSNGGNLCMHEYITYSCTHTCTPRFFGSYCPRSTHVHFHINI